ncbi:hypothetical protein [Dyella choica]|nr:hypothetical protein [Dyella choica]
MVLKIFKSMLVILLAFACLECSAGVDDYGGRIYFAQYNRGEVHNPFLVFPSQFNYYVDPSLRSVTFTIGGRSYSIDVLAATEAAMAEWQEILGNDLVFTPASSEAQALLVITGNQVEPSSPGLAETVMARSGSFWSAARNPSTAYYLRNIETSLNRNLGWFRANMARGTSDEDVLRMLIRFVALHEMGHVLGFHHPSSMVGDAFDRILDSWFGNSQVVVLESYQNPSIPLMEAQATAYFPALRERLGRPLLPSDVGISPQEREALAKLRTRARTCPRPNNSSRYGDHGIRGPVNADDCAPFKIIIQQPAGAALLLLGS